MADPSPVAVASAAASGGDPDPPRRDEGEGDDNGSDEDGSPDVSADDLRRLANARFADRDYDVALPLYSAAVDAARAEDSAHEAEVRESERVAREATAESEGYGGLGGVDLGPADGGVGAGEEDDGAYHREPSAVLHLCNRSACLYRMERYEEARNDAREAVDLCRGRNSKAWFRLARAQMALQQYGPAVGTLESALRNLDREEGELDEEAEMAAGGEAPPSMDDEEDDEEEEKASKGDEDEAMRALAERRRNLELQRRELTKLLAISKRRKAQQDKEGPPPPKAPVIIKSVKLEPRQPSIKEFEMGRELGVGNFSRIVVCRHKTTGEEFALKIIEKKKAEQLAKREHPNVYNEIKMERRVLAERLPRDPSHPRLVRLYHAFQDYGSLYFLMELHAARGDLWSQLRDRDRMVGCHPSLARMYLSELLDAVEFLHMRGVVHRDLKPENVILSDRGHIVLLDLGTAKDMVYTDLNGPEFVGTADYMAPEMVRGTSGGDEVARDRRLGRMGADHTADLWAFGCIVYQLFTGMLPFASPSPYLGFLKIRRGNVCRQWGISDDDAWDLIRKLLKVDPKKRLGAKCFDFTDAAVTEEGDKSEDKGGSGGEDFDGDLAVKKDRDAWKLRKIGTYGTGYDVIRRHPFFAKGFGNVVPEPLAPGPVDIYSEPSPVPSLRDLCIRAVAELVRLDSLNLEIDSQHPPGDGSSHDMLRLAPADRLEIMHYLDRLRLLPQPRVYRRFFKSRREARLGRVRPWSRDCVGLTQMGDGQGQFPSKECSENVDPKVKELAELGDPIQIVHISNPLFLEGMNKSCGDEERKEHIEKLKDSIRNVNRRRPKLAVACGFIDEPCRKLLAKVNETIPIVLCDGSEYFSFWSCGAQFLALRSRDLLGDNGGRGGGDSEDDDGPTQESWLREQLEQSRTTGHHLFVFVDADPRLLPPSLTRRLARGKALCLFGVSEGGTYEGEVRYKGGPRGGGGGGDSGGGGGGDSGDDGEDDDEGVASGAGDEKESPAPEVREEFVEDDREEDASSVESADEKPFTMKVVSTGTSRLCCITLEEYGVWKPEVI